MPKLYCAPCDKVTKAGIRCPHCAGPLQDMGTRWRPGRAGTRTRMWDRRQETRRSLWAAPWMSYLPAQRPVERVGRKQARSRAQAARLSVPRHRESFTPR